MFRKKANPPLLFSQTEKSYDVLKVQQKKGQWEEMKFLLNK